MCICTMLYLIVFHLSKLFTYPNKCLWHLTNVEGNAECNVEGNVEGDAEGNAECNVEGNVESNVEGNAEDNAECNVEGNAECNAEGKSGCCGWVYTPVSHLQLPVPPEWSRSCRGSLNEGPAGCTAVRL